MSLTEIAYVLSPDWDHYLFTSLHTLFESGSSFDRVKIYCVGDQPDRWSFSDPRIVVEEVSPLAENYFHINKTYICRSDADRIIFLDADTLVLQSLDAIWKETDVDFIGRVASGYFKEKWDQQAWSDAMHRVDADHIVPYFNCGFFVLQNDSQNDLSLYWERFTRELMDGNLPDPGVLQQTIKFSEQVALSLAIGSTNLSYQELSSQEHAYGWSDDPFADAIVYHTGGPSFFLFTHLIDRTVDLELDDGFLSQQSTEVTTRIRRQLWFERFKLVVKKMLRPLRLYSSARSLFHRARALIST